MKHNAPSFWHQCKREWHLYVRQPRIIINAALFFLVIVVFFPLTMPPDPDLLRTLSPGLIWIAVLFAFFLSGENLFQQEDDDGVLAQWLLSGTPLVLFVLAKLTVHWLLNILAMLLLLPIYAVLFGLNSYEARILSCSLICGTPAMIALCTFSAAFGLGIKQKSTLMALVLFPLTLPLIIFGSAITTASMQGQDVSGYMALLLSMSLLSVSLIPLATAGVIRAATCR